MPDREYNWPLHIGDAQFLLDYFETSFPGYVRDHVYKCNVEYMAWFIDLKNQLFRIIYEEE